MKLPVLFVCLLIGLPLVALAVPVGTWNVPAGRTWIMYGNVITPKQLVITADSLNIDVIDEQNRRWPMIILRPEDRIVLMPTPAQEATAARQEFIDAGALHIRNRLSAIGTPVQVIAESMAVHYRKFPKDLTDVRVTPDGVTMHRLSDGFSLSISAFTQRTRRRATQIEQWQRYLQPILESLDRGEMMVWSWNSLHTTFRSASQSVILDEHRRLKSDPTAATILPPGPAEFARNPLSVEQARQAARRGR